MVPKSVLYAKNCPGNLLCPFGRAFHHVFHVFESYNELE